MNLLINLIAIKNEAELNKLYLKIEDKTILETIISQVNLSTVDKIIIMVLPEFEESIKELACGMQCFKKISFKLLETKSDIEIASSLDCNNIVSMYKNFRAINLQQYFDNSINLNQSTVIMDGTKLYKKNVFNFKLCSTDAYVKFENLKSKASVNYMLFLKNTVVDQTTDIKKIVVQDYKYNFIDINNLKTIIESSKSFSENKQLRLEYVNLLFERFDFVQVLDVVKKYAANEQYWTMFYLEILEAYGEERELIDFYTKNANYINNCKFTNSQLNDTYKNTFNMCHLIATEQSLVNKDIKQYINEKNLDFKFVSNSIRSSKLKQLNLSFLIRELIESTELDNDKGLILLELIDALNVNPYLKMKNIVDICDYFMLSSRYSIISHKLINKLFTALLQYKELFTSGINNRIEQYATNMNITPRTSDNNIVNFDCTTHKFGSANKVAVCITGTAKYNYKKNLELLHNFLSRNLDVDYFVQSWGQYEEYPGLSSLGKTQDNLWANYYLNRLNKQQPTFISRQANFEAIMPLTAELLFTKKFSNLSKQDYIEILGSNIKAIKKYDFNAFLNKIDNGGSEFDEIKEKTIKYFERGRAQKILNEYIAATGQKYDYVINIDINTVLKSVVQLEDLQNLKSNECVVLSEGDGKIGIGYTAARFDTARYINSLWDLCQLSKNTSPYLFAKQPIVDKEQDPLLLHMIRAKLEITTDVNKYGSPYTNKKIKLPSVEATVKRDLENYEGDASQIYKYFNLIEEQFTSDYPDNTNYQLIHKVELIDSDLVDNGVVIDLSIKGEGLKTLEPKKFYLHGISNFNLDSTFGRVRYFKKRFLVLKHEDDEIVLRRLVRDDFSEYGKDWRFTLLFHDFTLAHYNIEFKPKKSEFELTKYGIRYIQTDPTFSIGMSSKTYFLNNL